MDLIEYRPIVSYLKRSATTWYLWYVVIIFYGHFCKTPLSLRSLTPYGVFLVKTDRLVIYDSSIVILTLQAENGINIRDYIFI